MGKETNVKIKNLKSLIIKYKPADHYQDGFLDLLLGKYSNTEVKTELSSYIIC